MFFFFRLAAEQLADFNIEPIPKISANGENGIAKSRLRRNGHLAPKNESERTSSLNGNQLQVLDTIRRKRTNAVSTDLQPVLRPKRKNTENQIEPLQQAALHLDDADLEPVKSGRAVRKTTRNLRSGSTKPAKEATETSIEILNGKVSGKSNDMVKEVNNVKKNPTPAMLEIMRKLNQKKKT